MIPYILLAAWTLFCWLFLYIQTIGRRAFLVLVLVPAALILGLRGSSVGEDTAMYLSMANLSQLFSWSQLNPFGASIIWNPDQWGYGASVDPGYLLYCKILMSLCGSAEMVQFITTLITCTLIGVFLECNAEDVGEAYWVFLCGGLYMFAFNGMRQMLALSIAINFFQFARNHKWIKAAAIILLASLLHRTTLLLLGFLLVYFFLQFKKTYIISVVIALTIPVLINVMRPLVAMISPQYASYYSNKFWSASFGGSMLVFAVIAGCAIALMVRKDKTNEIKFMTFCCVAYLGFEFSAVSISIMERLALYALAFVCLAFTEMPGLKFNGDKLVVLKSNILPLIYLLVTNLLMLGLYWSYAGSASRTWIPWY